MGRLSFNSCIGGGGLDSGRIDVEIEDTRMGMFFLFSLVSCLSYFTLKTL